MAARAPLRYLSAPAVEALLPQPGEQVELAKRALAALERGEVEMPPKIGVHPRPGALLHAMPAWLRDDDLVGMKWVSAYPGNTERGEPAIQGVIVLNDPDTGTPRAVMDASVITAVRTAAVTGVAVATFADAPLDRVAILGCGTQSRSHARLLTAMFPDIEIVAYDRHPERAQAFVAFAREVAGVATVTTAPTAREAVRDTRLVITCGAITTAQEMTPDWLASPALIVAVDFAAYVSAEIASTARAFVVDDRAQFEAYRDAGYFDGYPDPTLTLGEALRNAAGASLHAGAAAREGGRHTVVTHLGVGVADVLFAEGVLRTAEARGVGTLLER